MKNNRYGHWNIKFVGDFDPENYQGFTYKTVNILTGSVYIGRKFFWRPNGKPHNWKNYKTSSKSVLKEIDNGVTFTFYIIELFKTKNETIIAETRMLRDREVVKFPDRYYNRTINCEEYYRDRQSYDNVEYRKNKSEAMLNWLKENQHPLKGKVHPNKGKRLPQTAPKEHVSLTKIQITNGKENKFYPKDEPIPDGWRIGLTQFKKRAVTEKTKYSAIEVGNIISKRKEEEYYKDPKTCSVCASVLIYEKRKNKTCGNKCYSKLRSEVSQNTFDIETNQKSVESRKRNLAKSKGYDSHSEYLEAIIEYYKHHTNDETRNYFGCSKMQIISACNHTGFSKRVSKE